VQYKFIVEVKALYWWVLYCVAIKNCQTEGLFLFVKIMKLNFGGVKDEN
jgi:hypothetical protein